MDEEQIKALEAKAAKADELEATLKAKEEELSKLAGKDMNFKRLRDKSDAEIAEMKAKMTVENQQILDELRMTQQERDADHTKRTQEAAQSVLDSLSNGDAELRKSIEIAEKEIAGEARTPRELEERFRKAYILAKGERPAVNPLFSGYNSSYKEPDLDRKRFSDTEEGKASIQQWFPSHIVKKVYKDK